MALVNSKFATHKKHYFFQPLLTGLFVFITLFAFGGYKHEEVLAIVGITSLGSSAFLAFSAPRLVTASVKAIFCGYIVSIILGITCWKLAHWVYALDPEFFSNVYIFEIFGAVAIIVAIFIMAIFTIEHPPAAGLSVGLVMEPWTVATLMTILMLLILLVLMKQLLKSRLISLI